MKRADFLRGALTLGTGTILRVGGRRIGYQGSLGGVGQSSDQLAATVTVGAQQRVGTWPLIELGFDPFEDNPYLNRLIDRGFRLANCDLATLHRPYFDKEIKALNAPQVLKHANPEMKLAVYIDDAPDQWVEDHPRVWFKNTAGVAFQGNGGHYPDPSHPDYIARQVSRINPYVKGGGRLWRKPIGGFHLDHATWWRAELDHFSPRSTNDELVTLRQHRMAGWRAIRDQVLGGPAVIFDVESEGQDWSNWNVNQAVSDPYWAVMTHFNAVYFAKQLRQNGERARYLKRTFDALHAAGQHVLLADDEASNREENLGWYYCFFLCFSDGQDYIETDPLPAQAFTNPGDERSPLFRLQALGPAVNTGGNVWRREFDKAIVTVDLSGNSRCSFVRR